MVTWAWLFVSPTSVTYVLRVFLSYHHQSFRSQLSVFRDEFDVFLFSIYFLFLPTLSLFLIVQKPQLYNFWWKWTVEWPIFIQIIPLIWFDWFADKIVVVARFAWANNELCLCVFSLCAMSVTVDVSSNGIERLLCGYQRQLLTLNNNKKWRVFVTLTVFSCF